MNAPRFAVYIRTVLGESFDFRDGTYSMSPEQQADVLLKICGATAPKSTRSLLSVINAHYKSNLKSELASQMIDNPSPTFTLKDVEGNTVYLHDFKGKVIVIDFWATWCAPCKASFPVMQRAVDRYLTDSTVHFLFIHTFERRMKSPLEDAVKYLSDNNYSFKLYMDYADQHSKVNPAALAFGIKSIPTKFVVDAKGRIRFTSGGYSLKDSETHTLEEMCMMIELAKESTQ